MGSDCHLPDQLFRQAATLKAPPGNAYRAGLRNTPSRLRMLRPGGFFTPHTLTGPSPYKAFKA